MLRVRPPATGVIAAVILATGLVVGPARAATPDLSPEEQQLIYELNLARRDPAGYAAQHPDLAGSAAIAAAVPRPPLAVTDSLFGSAGSHAGEMAATGYVAHQSPVTGMWPNEMTRRAGYPLVSSLADADNNVESVTAGDVPSPGAALAALLDSEPHRTHLLGITPFFALHRQVGAGWAVGAPWADGAQPAGYWVVHTGYDGGAEPFLTGVVYDDANDNGRMDLGEGLPDAEVAAGGVVTRTNAGGGWAIRVVPDRRYEVVVRGDGFTRRSRTVSVASDNVEVDVSITTAREAVSLFDPVSGAWYLRFADGSAESFYFGNPGDLPLMGDWDCDGADTVGLYRPATGVVLLGGSNSTGRAVLQFPFGGAGDVPLVGDWDGDGCDPVAVYRRGEVLVSNRVGGGNAQSSYFFGEPGDRPFSGDFDGDGRDTVGLYRESTGFVYFRNEPTTGVAEVEFYYGVPSDRIVAGDWNGDGVDTVGVFRPAEGRLYLSNVNQQGRADLELAVGRPGWLPVAGRPG